MLRWLIVLPIHFSGEENCDDLRSMSVPMNSNCFILQISNKIKIVKQQTISERFA